MSEQINHDEAKEKMIKLVNEWHEQQSHGLDVLASHALDQLKEMIEDVYP